MLVAGGFAFAFGGFGVFVLLFWFVIWLIAVDLTIFWWGGLCECLLDLRILFTGLLL